MELLLVYLLKSTICISVLYLVFRWTLKKESLFALNRFLLLAILVISVATPLIKRPVLFNQTIEVNEVFPEKTQTILPYYDDMAMKTTTIHTIEYTPIPTGRTLTVEQVATIIYAVGVLWLFIALLITIAKIGLLLLKTKVYRREDYNLALVDGIFSPMSIGRFIIMSKQDYKDHRKEIIKHELTHIKFKHTYDLLMVELVKLFHWFNPLVYQLRNDLKEIQEFQVDQHLLDSGINSKEYQLLLIKKCVGTERYALANSFNHCQIKNRITMMNHSKKQKTKIWKLMIFLPFILFILFAFSKADKSTETVRTNKQNASEPESSNFSIEGAWTYVLSLQIKDGNTCILIEEGSKYNEMKIWSKDHFAFVGNQGLGSYPFGGTGKYKLNGNYYEETVITAPLKSGNDPEIVKMRMEMKNDTLIQIWPADVNGNYDPKNHNMIKMVRMK